MIHTHLVAEESLVENLFHVEVAKNNNLPKRIPEWVSYKTIARLIPLFAKFWAMYKNCLLYTSDAADE